MQAGGRRLKAGAAAGSALEVSTRMMRSECCEERREQVEKGKRMQRVLACISEPPPIAGLKLLPHTRSCFVCGEANPAGLKLRFETDGRLDQTRFVPRPEHVGFRQTVHGGLVATLLDEIMVWACAVQTKRFAFCAELNVQFISPVRPDEPVVASGELVSNRRDKLFEARAGLRNQAWSTLVAATGKYLPIKHANVTEMVTDFVEDPGWVFGAGT
jgi:uncharacterized protein (TIGR00369 family)